MKKTSILRSYNLSRAWNFRESLLEVESVCFGWIELTALKYVLARRWGFIVDHKSNRLKQLSIYWNNI